MKQPLKIALSLLISLVLFAAVAILAYTGLFNLIDTRLYNPSVVKTLTIETARDARLVERYILELQGVFADSLGAQTVRRSFLPNQGADDIYGRSSIYGAMLESISGLQSIRFIDSNGIRIHYSTDINDIIAGDNSSVTYRNYTEDAAELPFEKINTGPSGPPKTTVDLARDRIVFSLPFRDAMEIYRGTALFSVSIRAVAGRLIRAGRMKVSEDFSVIGSPTGFVCGSPENSKTEIFNEILSIWSSGAISPAYLKSAGSGVNLTLITAKISQDFFYGRLYSDVVFSFPVFIKIILLAAAFLTIFLAVFFIFNIRQDPLIIVQNRLKNLHLFLIEEFYEKKNEMDWERWSFELEQRRDDIKAEVKRGLKTGEKTDQLIDKSWDELLAVLGANRGSISVTDKDKIKNILIGLSRQLPASTGELVPSGEQSGDLEKAEKPDDKTAEKTEAEQLDELDELEEVEEIEEFFEHAAGKKPALAGELNEIEPAAELAEVENFDEIEELEEAGEIEEVEEIVDPIADEEPEPFINQINTEPAAELMEVENFDEIEEFESAEEIDEAGEVTEQSVQEFEELESLEEIDDSAGHEPPEQNEEDIASRIEFDAGIVAGVPEEAEVSELELEVVSPFMSMVSSLDGKDADNQDESNKADDDKD